MADYLLSTSLLDAVNTLLQSVGETRVEDVESDLEEVIVARDTLNEVVLEHLTWGWTFNTDVVSLEPEVGTGRITLPANTLSVDAVDPHYAVVQRGNCLYDVAGNTFVFKCPVRCKLVSALDFECLPQHSKQYVLARAGRRYTERFLGADTYTRFSQIYEQECERLFKRIEGRHGDYNILTGSNSTVRVLDRYPRSRRSRGIF